ncbi:hypothetical protein P43SY_003211 [Pythium insidiosum]|uniref:Uncharacterized protein n=1 Tax=Pythium insidiosum TaxID=114742 RepID=A0AAD5LKR4_PYTIN|nr:hypothetical protein P43SY_003211 [Pythium insidiosum]
MTSQLLVSAEVVGVGCDGTEPSLVFAVHRRGVYSNDQTLLKRYLFNCGEGTQRLCGENGIKLGTLDAIFLTRLDVQAASGIPGLIFALGGLGAAHLRIHGPPGTYDRVVGMRSFARRKYPQLEWDTKPCDQLVRAGMDATLLIHEATFDDTMEDDAERKKHSTVGQALGVARRMRAQQVVLTHFSQRYPSLPPAVTADTADGPVVCCAFDGLVLSLPPAPRRDDRPSFALFPPLHIMGMDSQSPTHAPTQQHVLQRQESSSPPLLSGLQSGESDIPPIYKFVLTGGPCAGKTTSLDRLSTFFRDRGFRVYVVPEASTLLQTGGAFFLDMQEKDHLNFQWQILKMQMTMEDSFYSLAQDSGKPCVILCDRGAMDGSAYVTAEKWEELKALHDLDTVTLRDTRYIAVFHLVTAADGAEKFYSLDNNGTRIETIEQAREIDARTCRAWTGHPKLYIFDNSTGFEGKMQRLVDTAAGLCGIPSTVKASRKFLLKQPPNTSLIPVHHEDFEVEKVYLTPESADTSKDYSFVRCRSQFGIPAYGMTTVRYLQTGDSVHLKRVLSAREYAYAVRHRSDPDRFVIKQQRICFLYKNQSFQIHVYKEPPSMVGLSILHVQASTGANKELEIPSFLEIERELQEQDESYSAYNVSLKSRATK